MGFIGKKPTAAPLTSSDVEDGIITNAKLAQDIISAETALGATPADTDEFLVSDAGTLKRMDYSYIKGGITEADQWRLTTDLSGDTDPISANLERVDDATFEKIGTGMSVSSGRWTFGATGLYLVRFTAVIQADSNDDASMPFQIKGTSDDSTYDELTQSVHSGTQGVVPYMTGTTECLFNCENTSTHKVSFLIRGMNSNNLTGGTNETQSNFMFIRLGDSQ
jgi:hypothetical protein